MKIEVGLWIDHREAVIVTVTAEGISEQVVHSKVEGHVRYSGGTGSGGRGSRAGEGEDKRERSFEGQLAKYYDEVIAHIGSAKAIFIFGPGEAKDELKSRLEHRGLGAHIVGVEAADKMTQRQIAAKVRQRFAPETSPRLMPPR